MSEIEVADPTCEHGLGLFVEVDRHRQEQTECDQKGHPARERDPREVVVELGQVRRAVGPERSQEPEDRGGEEHDRSGPRDSDHAIAQHRRAMCHQPHALDDQHQRSVSSATQNQLNRIML